MKSTFAIYLVFLLSLSTAWGQEEVTVSLNDGLSSATDTSPSAKKQQIVKITGVRFSYPLVQQWIDGFNEAYPDVQVIIESRGTADPSQFDILVEAFEHPEEIRKGREYLYVARYAILPVANNKSEFAKVYGDKGLDKDLIKQLFFHDIYADKEKQKEIKAPFTVYTRLQKAGAPIVFARYFGYEQKDIKGKAIAGSDEHLIKALLRDSTGLSYAPLPLIYDRTTGKPVDGITVIPVDLNGNNKVNDEEKFYGDLAGVTQRLEDSPLRDINNIPIEYIHLSIDRKGASVEAITFLRWVINHGEKDIHAFGYLKPEPGKLEKEKFEQFASKKIK